MNHNCKEIFKQQEFLLKGKPVITLIGNEFAKREGITLTQQVTEYYDSIGKIAISPDYGEIMLDKQSVEDDFAHGIGRIKAIAYAAVPAIIEKGIVILPLGNHKQNEKLYVHEVFLKRKLLDGSSNPAHIPATNQGVIPESSVNKQKLVTNKGNIAKVLQKIISAKSD